MSLITLNKQEYNTLTKYQDGNWQTAIGAMPEYLKSRGLLQPEFTTCQLYDYLCSENHHLIPNVPYDLRRHEVRAAKIEQRVQRYRITRRGMKALGKQGRIV